MAFVEGWRRGSPRREAVGFRVGERGRESLRWPRLVRRGRSVGCEGITVSSAPNPITLIRGQ